MKMDFNLLALAIASAGLCLLGPADKVSGFELLDRMLNSSVSQKGGCAKGGCGAHQKGAHQKGAHQKGAHQKGAHQKGAHQKGAHQKGAHQKGAHQKGAHQKGGKSHCDLFSSLLDKFKCHGKGKGKGKGGYIDMRYDTGPDVEAPPPPAPQAAILIPDLPTISS